VEVRIDTAFAKGNIFFGLKLDGFYDFIAIHFPSGQELQDEQFRDAIKE
jgi:hypothetical protein